MCVPVYVCVCVWMWTCVSMYACMQVPSNTSGLPGVRSGCEPPYMGAGTKTRPSARAANAHNLWAISSVQILIFLFKIDLQLYTKINLWGISNLNGIDTNVQLFLFFYFFLYFFEKCD